MTVTCTAVTSVPFASRDCHPSSLPAALTGRTSANLQCLLQWL